MKNHFFFFGTLCRFNQRSTSQSIQLLPAAKVTADLTCFNTGLVLINRSVKRLCVFLFFSADHSIKVRLDGRGKWVYPWDFVVLKGKRGRMREEHAIEAMETMRFWTKSVIASMQVECIRILGKVNAA